LLSSIKQNIHIRNFLYLCVRFSGLPFIFREVFQKNKVTILLFHDIEPRAAEKAFRYLLNKYNIISLDDFFDLYRKKEDFPPKSLVITFDDGHKGNYDLLPILKKYDIPVTIFLCSGIINTNRHFWYEEARAKAVHLPLTGEQLKKVPNIKRLQILKGIGFEQQREYAYPNALSRKQICEMLPYANFQSHTVFHPCLTECDDSEAWNEIFVSKRILEEKYGLTVNSIAYPNGDYSDRDIQMSVAAGYEFGLTVDFGFNTCNTNPFRLKRVSVNDTDNMNELIAKSSGAWAFLKDVMFRIRT
jgi:peptidoglycan/xylan/chitin deacetylase (PgdA/CDA1 family)